MLESQYRAGLAMLKAAIERCPDHLWNDSVEQVAFWRVAYHTLYFTQFYLAPNQHAFRPWAKARGENHLLGPLPSSPDRQPTITEPYTRAELLEYCELLSTTLDEAVDQLDLEATECGFPWYKMSKLEHQIVNIRHLQHHVAMLSARVRESTGKGVGWVGSA
jgi:hypothetical protein